MTDDSNPSPEIYKVGYRRPPIATRFKPGTSGNPGGRRSKTKSLQSMLSEALSAKSTVVERGRKVKKSRLEIILMQMVIRALSGDPRAIDHVFKCYDRLDRANAIDGDPLFKIPSIDDTLFLRRKIEDMAACMNDQSDEKLKV